MLIRAILCEVENVPVPICIELLPLFEPAAEPVPYKTILSRYNNTTGETAATVHLWSNTSAINYIILKTLSNNSYNSGSTFTLYGITAA